MKVQVFLAVICCAFLVHGQTPRQRAQALLAQMNQDEKIQMVHGSGGGYVGNVPANNRLKIPALNLEDGPQGVADGVHEVTCWPASLTLSATWDTNLVYAWSQAMAAEQRIKGTNVMLGPDINIVRTPVGGRNFEMFGEDPFLTSTLVVPSVKGIQSQGVIACAKHYINNDEEYQRNSISVNVDERTNWEIYYPPFQAAVNAGVGSMMCSYNRINNTYACENHQTLTVDLKQRMGFQGWMMSDWGATHSTVNAANNGLDQQMPDGGFFGQALQNAISSGQVPQSRLDDMVLRILTSMYAVGLFDNPQTGDLSKNATSKAHDDLARSLSAAATVLLKNEGVLPLDLSKVKTIAVIGPDGNTNPMPTGGGSGGVACPYIVTPFNGIKNRAGSGVTVTYYNGADAQQAANIAKSVDVPIVFGHAYSSEGGDRGDFNLQNNENQFVEAVVGANPNSVVVVHAVGAVLMPWANQAKAVLHAFVPGQEMGNAIADVLFGDVNPSARLPITIPASATQIPTNTPRQYPGQNGQIYYDEKLLVGYRWYDANNQAPLFPFGHGLSYTTFSYSDIKITGSIAAGGITVSASVTNSGKYKGSEVAQLYLSFPASAGEPPQVLKGISKLTLAAGETGTAQFTLTAADVSIWDIPTSKWRVINGSFGVVIGASSRDPRLKGSFTN